MPRPSTTTAATDTDTDTDTEQSTAPAEPDPQFFRTYHESHAAVGYSNESWPEELLVIAGHAIITPDRGGLMRFEYYACGDLLTHDETLAWTYLPESGAIKVHPDESGTIPGPWSPKITAMTLSLDRPCDGLTLTTEDAGARKNTYPFDPGRVCAEVSDPEKCRFSILWCDEGEPPPPCPEAP